MTEPLAHRIIPLHDLRTAARGADTLWPDPAYVQGTLPRDRLGRPLRDLRISVTDRCNFRCSYCMPKEVFDKDYLYLPQSALLSFEEIERVARQFVALGVEKIRLTGGEPLLRKNIERLIAQLAQLRTPDGHALDLTLTTNGSLLRKKAQSLRDAGLQRITVSLDGLDDQVFKRMNDVDFPVADVLDGIEAAKAAGLGPIKVNMVVQRGVNDHEIIPMARHFRGSGVVLRFIEYMDVGATNGWRMDQVLPSAQVIEHLQSTFALAPLEASAPGETAQRWTYLDTAGQPDAAAGEIGVISSVTQAFCGDCNRARLSTEGQLYLCLFASQGHDLRSIVRASADDTVLAGAIAKIWTHRDDRYSLLRAAMGPDTQTSGARRVEMSYIGG
jgi:cyclic pyranopterin phosphate synthase